MTDVTKHKLSITNIITTVIIGSFILGIIFLIVLVASPAEHDIDNNVIRGSGWALYVSASFFFASIVGCIMSEGISGETSYESLDARVSALERKINK